MSAFDTKRIGGSLTISLEKSDQRSVDQITPSSPRVWRRTTRANSFLAMPAMAPIDFFIQHILVAMERFLEELMTINKKVRGLAHVKSDMIERGDPLCRLFTKPQTCRLSRFFSLLQLDRIQLSTDGVCEHHTSHVHLSQ